MSDFHQRGLISTLPRLKPRSIDELEERLCALAEIQPAALILPCTLSDFRRPAMQGILREVREAKYFSRIVVSINQADGAEMDEVRHSLNIHGDRRIFIIWNDDPELLVLLPGAATGKGFNLWTAVGYLCLEKQSRVVVTHDTDILNYTRELPALLTLPLLDSSLDYQFVKGYYPRLSGQSGQLFGRVTRLFIGPLLRALVRVAGHHPLLDFLDSFRYPLSGEFGARLDELCKLTIPPGWDLEMDLLCAVHRTLTPEVVAQIDLGFNYEHKHQILTPGQHQDGLTQLAVASYSCLLKNLAREGVHVTPDFQKALQTAYQKSARETVRRYRHVASINQLDFNEEDEITLIEEFARILAFPPPIAGNPLSSWSDLKQNRPDWCAAFMCALGGFSRTENS